MSERFNDIDLAITDDGDLMLTDDGDLAIVEDIEYVAQMTKNRLRSVASDWYYDNIGADIETFIGKPNTKETCDELIAKITAALTSDAFCNLNDILIVANPLSTAEAMVGVFVKTDFSETPLGFLVRMNFLTGFSIERIQ